jgi:hypothetical protein
MSEVLAVRGSDLVMRELAQTKASVIEAQRVLIVGAGALPKLLGELNDSLAELGYVCVPIEPAQGLYKTFADLLACPSLAPLLETTELVQMVTDDRPHTHGVAIEPDPQQSAYAPYVPEGARQADAALDESSIVERQILALEQSLALSSAASELVAADPLPVVVDVSKLDMSKPINWKLGDVFQDNPRVTLPHKCRKWLLDSLDISDLENLSGMDVQIRSPNTTTTELLTLKQFMAQYVFHSRPVAEQSAAE